MSNDIEKTMHDLEEIRKLEQDELKTVSGGIYDENGNPDPDEIALREIINGMREGADSIPEDFNDTRIEDRRMDPYVYYMKP